MKVNCYNKVKALGGTGFSPLTWNKLILQNWEKTSGEPKKCFKAGRDGGRDGEQWSTERSWDYTHERDIRAEGRKKLSLKGLERDALALRC